MSTESYLWQKQKQMPNAHLTRHEDKINYGIPDVSFGFDGVNGWIENKAFKVWPPSDRIRFKNLTAMQVRFLENRGKTGGYCYLMLIVNRNKCAEYLLFHHMDLHRLHDKLLTRRFLSKLSIYHSAENINFKVLKKAILDHP